jgi:hypothetical protein
MTGKGDKRRPSWVTAREYRERWEAIFGEELRQSVELCPVCHKGIGEHGHCEELLRQQKERT